MAVHDMLMAAAGGTAGAVNYIDDVFSTYLYNGTGSSITNHTTGVNLKDYGGMLWIKMRNNYAGMGTSTGHALFSTDLPNADVVNDGYGGLSTNSTSAYWARKNYLREFLTTGFKNGTYDETNGTDGTFASWTFRKQEKFFDVVTYTGNGSTSQNIAHSLGSKPGCIIIKATSTTGDWWVTTRKDDSQWAYNLKLNTTGIASTWYPTSSDINASTFTTYITDAGSDTNSNGVTYVAYLFAHNAGGFGTAGTDNVISCGSYTSTGTTGTEITLGYEPQWVLIKRASVSGNNWFLFDNMRGMPTGGNDSFLYPNTSDAEVSTANHICPIATGFRLESNSVNVNGNGSTYIYIAIRRPMKPPTTGTEVFNVQTNSSNGSYVDLTDVGFPPDLVIEKSRSEYGFRWNTRLTGTNQLDSSNTNAAATDSNTNFGFKQTQPRIGFGAAKTDMIMESFRRAPGFFDVVCYTGTSPTPQNISHNLGVAPQMMIVKIRSISGDNWAVYHSALGNEAYLKLNLGNAVDYNGDLWDATTPTATTFRVGQANLANYGGEKLVAYLFATVAGVSKVGSYTGNGGVQQIDCGFSGGARFVMVKRTSASGDWQVYDTARGIVSGNDPVLFLNSTDAENTSYDRLDPYSGGFEVNGNTGSPNGSGDTFIYLAIA